MSGVVQKLPSRRSLRVVPALGLLALVAGCPVQGTTSEKPDDGEVSFSSQVQPILTRSCAGCHSPGGAADLAGIELQLTADVAHDLLVDRPSVQLPDLLLVAPGDSASSLLLLKVSSDFPPIGTRMPRFAPVLSDREVELIRGWIDQGAANN